MAVKIKSSRVIAINADTHKILRIFAAQNDKKIADVANEAILRHIAGSK